MKNKIRRYHPQFVADLRIAASYYDDISINLGNRLRATIQKHLELISDSPVGFGVGICDTRPTRDHRLVSSFQKQTTPPQTTNFHGFFIPLEMMFGETRFF